MLIFGYSNAINANKMRYSISNRLVKYQEQNCWFYENKVHVVISRPNISDQRHLLETRVLFDTHLNYCCYKKRRCNLNDVVVVVTSEKNVTCQHGFCNQHGVWRSLDFVVNSNIFKSKPNPFCNDVVMHVLVHELRMQSIFTTKVDCNQPF